jgi:hypothetical protein
MECYEGWTESMRKAEFRCGNIVPEDDGEGIGMGRDEEYKERGGEEWRNGRH